MAGESDSALRERLRAAATVAMKARDRVALDALRSALGAVDNAEAVAAPARTPGDEDSSEIAGAIGGVGSSDVARRELTEREVEAIVRAEQADLLTSADEYDRIGQPEAAANLRHGAEALGAALAA